MTGAGVDLASITRVTAALERHPRLALRVFTVAERQHCQGKPQRWATRWAAKEAVRKLYGAAGLPLPSYRDVEVVAGPSGAPRLEVQGVRCALALTLSHEGDTAVAVVTGTAHPSAFAQVPRSVRLPDRPDDAHKGTFGTVVVVGGSVGYSGAPLMSALAAARGGSGRVHLCVPEPIYVPVAAQALEVMTHPLAAEAGGLGPAALPALLDTHLVGATAIVVGPGMGRSPGAEQLVVELLDRLPAPSVVDADALNIAAARRHPWDRSGQPIVITPHPAEMGRLCGLETAEVQSRRRQIASTYAREHGVVVVLKGSDTVVAAADGRVEVSEVRAVALATGGSGDVLSGLLAAFLGQGIEAFDAAVAAVFIHAEAGLALQARLGRAGALPGDLLIELPAAQERVRRVIEGRLHR